MKEIFNSMEEFKIYAETLTDDELVKSFDYFSYNSSIEDDEELDVRLWWGYLGIIEEGDFLSDKTALKLRSAEVLE